MADQVNEDIYLNPSIPPIRALEAPASHAHFMITERNWDVSWFLAGTKWATPDALEALKTVVSGFDGTFAEALELSELVRR